MLELPAVTLCCIDTANHALALRAIAHSLSGTKFARAVFLTDALPAGAVVPEGVDVVPIAPIASRPDYSDFVLKSLLPHVATTHVLLIQWDGYVINPDAWDPGFLDCDYLGATWHWAPPGMRMGNGGFSLRSRRLLEALRDPRIAAGDAEDTAICQVHRALLEGEYAIRFGDEDAADRFAFEAAYPIGRPFGFHGLFNFCRVVPVPELAALAPTFSDAIAASPQLAQLLRNCAALAQWPAVAAIARRRLAARADDGDARGLLAEAERALARGPSVGRNEPCPCGSGKRFKHCHGSVDDAPPAGPAFAGSPPGESRPSADALVARAMEAHQRGDLAAAELGYRAALTSAPDHPHALHYLGVILYQQQRLSEAFPLLQRAVERMPQEPEFHNNLGLALLAADRTDEAIASHRRAIELAPRHVVAWNNLGLAHQARNDIAAAIDAFRRALAIDPQFAEAHWNLGLALLLAGEFTEGWVHYDWRLAIPRFQGGRPAVAAPLWDGDDPAGKTILLTAEQGLGDTLHFARCASWLAARGARVAIQAPDPLLRLLARVAGIAQVHPSEGPAPPCDAYVPLLSVCGRIGITAATIPADVPYLACEPILAATVTHELAAHRGSLKVGLSWAGSRAHVNDRRRSCPLAALAPLLELPGVTWFSLQKDDGEDQIPDVALARTIVLAEARRDFDRKAALMCGLDLVVSVDTSNAHLAGALGRPVWIMLPFAPDWRWFLERTDSPWYPTARLFRQPRPGDWDSVVATIGQALASFTSDRR